MVRRLRLTQKGDRSLKMNKVYQQFRAGMIVSIPWKDLVPPRQIRSHAGFRAFSTIEPAPAVHSA